MNAGELFGPSWRIVLSVEEARIFGRTVALTSGGHEDFLRELHAGERTLGDGAIELQLSERQLDKAYRYTKGQGGHQHRFKALIRAAWRAGWRQPG